MSFLDRLYKEHEELEIKVVALKDFLDTLFYKTLYDIEKDDLKVQLQYMELYLAVLNKRINRLR